MNKFRVHDSKFASFSIIFQFQLLHLAGNSYKSILLFAYNFLPSLPPPSSPFTFVCVNGNLENSLSYRILKLALNKRQMYERNFKWVSNLRMPKIRNFLSTCKKSPVAISSHFLIITELVNWWANHSFIHS